MMGTQELAGANKKDPTFKTTITSNDQLSQEELKDIKDILDSFTKL